MQASLFYLMEHRHGKIGISKFTERKVQDEKDCIDDVIFDFFFQQMLPIFAARKKLNYNQWSNKENTGACTG